MLLTRTITESASSIKRQEALSASSDVKDPDVENLIVLMVSIVGLVDILKAMNLSQSMTDTHTNFSPSPL